MRARPDASELLIEAVRTLREEVAPGLSGDVRFRVLMAASAVAIAGRGVEEKQAVEHAAEKVDGLAASHIRMGHHDGDRAMHEALVDLARAQLRISNPAALK